MKNFKWKLTAIITFILAAGIFYYVTLPAINIHSRDFWIFDHTCGRIESCIRMEKRNPYES